MIKEQHAENILRIQGDFSIAGVKEQLPELARLLARVNATAAEDTNQGKPYEIDLSGVQALDTSGVQLLAIFFHFLKQRKIKGFFLKISDEYRDKIHLLGFANEIFDGDAS